jgi:hypothetical protein
MMTLLESVNSHKYENSSQVLILVLFLEGVRLEHVFS